MKCPQITQVNQRQRKIRWNIGPQKDIKMAGEMPQQVNCFSFKYKDLSLISISIKKLSVVVETCIPSTGKAETGVSLGITNQSATSLGSLQASEML